MFLMEKRHILSLRPWNAVILDEGHRIRNHDAAISVALRDIFVFRSIYLLVCATRIADRDAHPKFSC